MNNLMTALAERAAAVWIERIAGSKISTVAGILGITATFAGQLSTYIPDAWRSYVTLGGVILAGVAAILSRDSAQPIATAASSGSTAKLGCWALIALLVMGTVPVMGCSAQKVAQDIVNWTPALQSAVATVDTSAAVLDPSAAPIFAAATVGFDQASNLLVAQAKAYLANPNAAILAQLQAQVVTFQQQVNSALLQAAKITNPASQQHATTAINGVATIVNTILALVVSISSKTQVAAMSAAAPIKLAQVQPYLNYEVALDQIQKHYSKAGEPGYASALTLVDVGYAELQEQGF